MDISITAEGKNPARVGPTGKRLARGRPGNRSVDSTVMFENRKASFKLPPPRVVNSILSQESRRNKVC